jgi:hypothetical protein
VPRELKDEEKMNQETTLVAKVSLMKKRLK